MALCVVELRVQEGQKKQGRFQRGQAEISRTKIENLPKHSRRKRGEARQLQGFGKTAGQTQKNT